LLVAILIILNSVVFTSSTNLKDVDLRYLSGLIIICIFCFFLLDFSRYKGTLLRFHKKMTEAHILDTQLLLKESDMVMMKEVIDLIIFNYEKELNVKDQGLEEIEMYLNQWIHEIKIPIAVSTMIADQLSGVQKEELLFELERIRHYTTTALYISKANHYESDLFIEEMDPVKIINEVIRDYKIFFIKKDISIEVANHLSHDKLMTDKKWFMYIVGQILHNSTKYMDPSGHISIELFSRDHQIHIGIKDNGIGISPSDIGRVFEKGFVGSNGRLHSKSTGMGLYLSKKMAELLHIRLSVSSEQYKYTTFTLVFAAIDSEIDLLKQHSNLNISQ
jgi:signal transduction histidine kinase